MQLLSRNRFLNVHLLVLAACAQLGCSELDNCPDGEPDIGIETGETNAQAGMYQSAPFWGPRNRFPAKTTLHFKHRLGFVPEELRSYVSFTEQYSSFSENAGNQGDWLCVDDEELVLRNSTCEDFYVVVSAHGSGSVHAPCACAERKDDGSCPER